MENNNNKKSAYGNSGKAEKSSADPTIEKAKSEINAQTDAMLREIEERRQRRTARQREIEQQIQAEEEAKARRMARRKAQEEANLTGIYPKNVPTVSSSDGVINNNAVKSEISSSENFPTGARFDRRPSSSEQPKTKTTATSGERRSRRVVSAGETQVLPKITEAVPQKPPAKQKSSASSKTPRRAPERSNSVRANSQADSGRSAAPKKVSSAPKGKPNKKNKEVNVMKEIREWVVAIAIAVVMALLIRNFVFTLVKVQGSSMQPTLQENDRLYVNRFFYSPNKGDVVIFKPASDPERPYVKRVIATEGDTVFIDFETGDVYVNDELLNEPYISEKTSRTGAYIRELIASGNYSKDNPIVVEKGKIFVMGDNRNNSKDSREIGQIPESELIGGAVFRFWPLAKFGSVDYEATTSYLIEDENMNFKIVA